MIANVPYNDHGKPDPMVALVTENGEIAPSLSDLTVSELSLQGLMADDKGNSMAIINNKVLKVNDRVGNFTVDQINATQVILVRGDERTILSLSRKGK